MKMIKTIVEKVSVPSETKTKQKEYLNMGAIPIIDQGQSLIGGFTNDIKKIISCDLPVIVFGDHTCCIKYVDFPFGAGADGIKVLRPKDGVNPKYLYYGLQYLVLNLQNRGYGRHYQHIEKLGIPVPILHEQKIIVSQIEESLSQLDSAVETLKKTKQQLEIYRQAVLKEAFEGNYPCIALSEISQAISGYAFKSKLYSKNGKYRVVKIGNVKPFHFDFTRDDTHTDEVNEKILSKYLLKQGDCIITQTGSRGKRDYGFVSMIEDEDNYLLNQRVAALRFNQAVAYPKFFQYYLSSKIFREVFFSYETGNVGQGNVGIKALTEPLVILPSISQQVQIVNRIESQLSLCYSIEKTVNQSLQHAEALRQSILKQAFEGK